MEMAIDGAETLTHVSSLLIDGDERRTGRRIDDLRHESEPFRRVECDEDHRSVGEGNYAKELERHGIVLARKC